MLCIPRLSEIVSCRLPHLNWVTKNLKVRVRCSRAFCLLTDWLRVCLPESVIKINNNFVSSLQWKSRGRGGSSGHCYCTFEQHSANPNNSASLHNHNFLSLSTRAIFALSMCFKTNIVLTEIEELLKRPPSNPARENMFSLHNASMHALCFNACSSLRWAIHLSSAHPVLSIWESTFMHIGFPPSPWCLNSNPILSWIMEKQFAIGPARKWFV